MSSRSEQARVRAAAVRAGQEALVRRQRKARLGAATAVLLVIGAAVALAVAGPDDGGRSSARATGGGGLQTGPPPWEPQPVGLAKRLAPFDLPLVGDESYHAHALLSVFRDGEPVTVPANIGFDERGGHSSLHTHTPDGVIHMEADNPYAYELAQVFAAWGVAFGDDRLGGDTADGTKQVHVYVNGEPASGPVTMDDGDNIVVAFGIENSFPKLPRADALEGA